MPTQSELIGSHPVLPNIFAKWLASNDFVVTANKSHRELTPLIPTTDNELIEWLGRKLFDHHYSDYRIKKLKQNYTKLGYDKYAEQHRKLPKAEKTKKGNATEIILTEYIESCLNKNLIKVFKLRYNPNVDQAIKGDDTLMVDIIKDKNKDRVKLYLGEAKFRKIPSKTVVEDIAKSLSGNKRPLSYSFLVEELGRAPETKDLADILDAFIIEEIKGKGDLVYTGLLLSNTKTSSVVESHLNSDNPQMVLISIGLENPEELIEQAFQKAEYFIENPDEI
jgi:hypothetical protein